MSKKKDKAEENIEVVENALSKTEMYIENNQKSLSVIILDIIVIVGGYMAFNKFYVAPMEDEAKSQMFIAEQYFAQDSFNLALNGDGNYLGFLDIFDEYGLTKSANLANYYIGISYLHLGQYEDAIEYLEKFDSEDNILDGLAVSAIGDAYAQLNEKEKARDYYLKAATIKPNEFTTPIFLFKAGILSEQLDDNQMALDTYKKLEKEYPNSNEARKIEKYVARVNLKLGLDN